MCLYAWACLIVPCMEHLKNMCQYVSECLITAVWSKNCDSYKITRIAGCMIHKKFQPRRVREKGRGQNCPLYGALKKYVPVFVGMSNYSNMEQNYDSYKITRIAGCMTHKNSVSKSKRKRRGAKTACSTILLQNCVFNAHNTTTHSCSRILVATRILCFPAT